MKENKGIWRFADFFTATAIFFIIFPGTGFFSFLYGLDEPSILRNSVAAGLGIGIVLFLMAQAKEYNLYDYDNRDYYGRFFLCFLAGFLNTVICAKLPAGGWPFVPLFVLLALFSNSFIGVCAGSVLLMISMLLSGAGIGVSFLYFISGTAAVCVFRNINGNYKVGTPIVISLIVLTVSMTAELILFENEKLNLDMLLIPFTNLALTCVLLIVILKLFFHLVIYKYRERYLVINDPECPLLVQLKEHSKEEYYRAVHTAYLSDKISKKLGFDDQAAKAGGYYHRIGCLQGENSWENVRDICLEYDFPPEVLAILQEFLQKDGKLLHKESAVLYFADAVVSSILFLIAKDADVKLDYDQIIDTIFRKKQEDACFGDCEISLRELNRMKLIFKEEKLYYDFLR